MHKLPDVSPQIALLSEEHVALVTLVGPDVFVNAINVKQQNRFGRKNLLAYSAAMTAGFFVNAAGVQF
jgi:hypothetical protein